MTHKNQQKLDEAVAAAVYESRTVYFGGYADPLKVGETVTLDVRFGDEGPSSWTRCEATIEERHLKLADKLQADME
jgi:hypothetical protein